MSDAISFHDATGALDRSTTGVDPEAFAALRSQFEGEDALFDGVVNLFDRELRPRVDAISDALRRGDASALAHAAHVLKGSSVMLGARHLAELCAQLEAAGKSGVLEPGATVLVEMEREAVRVRRDLERARRSELRK